ncbi:MAG TPA: amidohydrolase family protein [Myxococcota bacterium]|nr:amidohydrolase family protein [Myxococcota bacterium]
MGCDRREGGAPRRTIATCHSSERIRLEITPHSGLRREATQTIEIWSAYQQFEEKTKGSIEVGKLADLVVLSNDPLTMDRTKLSEIKVLETIKEGVAIYQLP